MKELKGPFVYFIGSDYGPIKIGRTVDIKKRLSGLQTAHSHTLKLLGILSEKKFSESDLHQKFAAHRLRGEWFERHDELIRFIMENRDQSIIEQYAPLMQPEIVHPDQGEYGYVQNINSKSKNYLKYGVYDDQESELLLECEFCEEAKERGWVEGPDAEVCDDCEYQTRAIVYYSDVRDGYSLVAHHHLRWVDEKIEAAEIEKAWRRIVPTAPVEIDKLKANAALSNDLRQEL